MTDVDVIIPAYKARETIARALAGVASQTLKPKRAIVVVDGSDDGTLEAAEAYRGRMNGVELRVIWQENQGAGAARNRAIEEATATYVAFLDADDEWQPEKLAQTLPHFTGADVVLVSHNVTVCDENRETRVDCFRHFIGSGGTFSSLYRRGYISTSTTVARRDAVLAAGGFDASLPNAQDFDLWLALTRAGETFRVFDGWLTRNHVTPDSIMSNTDRRLACCIAIADRYASETSLSDLYFRLTAIHWEAMNAHISQGRFFKAAIAGLRLPISLGISILKVLFDGDSQRRISVPEQMSENNKQNPRVTMALWLWIVVMTVAYNWQFLGYFDAIRSALGI